MINIHNDENYSKFDIFIEAIQKVPSELEIIPASRDNKGDKLYWIVHKKRKSLFSSQENRIANLQSMGNGNIYCSIDDKDYDAEVLALFKDRPETIEVYRRGYAL